MRGSTRSPVENVGQPPKPALNGVEGLSGRAKLDGAVARYNPRLCRKKYFRWLFGSLYPTWKPRRLPPFANSAPSSPPKATDAIRCTATVNRISFAAPLEVGSRSQRGIRGSRYAPLLGPPGK